MNRIIRWTKTENEIVLATFKSYPDAVAYFNLLVVRNPKWLLELVPEAGSLEDHSFHNCGGQS